jgi:hypothetical protein
MNGKSRARQLIAGLDCLAGAMNPVLLAIAIGLACMDASVFLVMNLYGEPKFAATSDDANAPATSLLDEFSRAQ